MDPVDIAMAHPLPFREGCDVPEVVSIDCLVGISVVAPDGEEPTLR